MSEEQAVQVVAQSVACVEEYEYQRVYRELLQYIDIFQEAQKRLAEAWFRENYPELRVRVKKHKRYDPNGQLGINISYIIDNLDLVPGGPQQIREELDAHLKQLEGR